MPVGERSYLPGQGLTTKDHYASNVPHGLPSKNYNDDDDTMNAQYTTELELGSLANNNKNQPDDIFDDEASQLTVATKNSAKDQYLSNVPHGLPTKNYENDDDNTMNEQYTTEVEGSLDSNNKNQPDDIFDDEASQLTVATKNSAKDQYAPNVPHGLPPKNYDDDDNTMNEQYTTEVELGSVDNNNKHRPDDIFDDAASLLVATKKSDEDQYASNVPHGLPPKNVPHERPIDFDLFPASSAGQDDVQFPKHPTKPKKTKKNRNKNKNKTKSTRQQTVGKQAANDNENQRSGTGSQATGSSQDTTMNDNSNSGSNNNSNKRQREDMNEKSNKWNDEQCPQQLGNDNDMTNIEELQSFNVNFNFQDVPKAKAGVLMVVFIHECLLKDNSV